MIHILPRRAAVGPRWLLPGLALVLAVYAIPYSRKALDGRSAFVRWQAQVVEVQQGVDIAAKYNYPNPPIMALLLYPLARLPEAARHLGFSTEAGLTLAALLWYFLKAGMTLIVFRWVLTLVSAPGKTFPRWACVVAAALSLRPVLSDLQHGNVNLFILFLVVAALVAYVRRWDFSSGLLLGLAIACKVTPALFLPYFVWKRAWRALAGSAVSLVLFLWPGIVPSAFLGAQYNQRLLGSWYHVMVYPYVIEGRVTSEHNNQSLPGLAARLLTHSPSFSTYVEDRYTPTQYSNLLDLPPRYAQWLVKACMAAFVLLVVWVCRTPSRQREGWEPWAEFGIILLGMLLFSERTWKHHCVTLVVPFAVLCYYLAACRPRGGLGACLVGTLTLATVLIATTSSGFGEERVSEKGAPALFAKQAQVYGAFVLADLVLLAALIVLLRHSHTTSSVEPLEAADWKTLPQPRKLEEEEHSIPEEPRAGAGRLPLEHPTRCLTEVSHDEHLSA